MATHPDVFDQIVTSHSDAIRIVPLHPGTEAAVAPAVAPQLTYRNGPLIASPEVFCVFWGAAWNTAPQKAMIQKLNQFFDFILNAPLAPLAFLSRTAFGRRLLSAALGRFGF